MWNQTSRRVAFATSIGLALTSAVVGFAAWPALPDPMPIHWNAHGVADGFAPKLMGVGLIPLMTVVIIAVSAMLSRRESEKNRSLLGWTMAITGVFMLGVQALVVHAALTPGFALMERVLMALMGALIGGLGMLMPHTEPNRYMGIRTKATLNDPTIWKLVHRFAAKSMGISGLVAIVASLIMSGPALFGVTIAAILIGTLSPAIYSMALGRAR